MEFLAFLPVIMFFLFVFFIVWSIKKRLLKAAEESRRKRGLGEKASGGSGWKELLGDAWGQIQAEIKKAQEQQERLKQQKASGNKARPGGKAERGARSKLLWDKNAPLPPPVPEAGRQARLDRHKTSRPETPRKEKPPVPEIENVPEPGAASPDREELRKAVVWSEILAPPIALRNERDDF